MPDLVEAELQSLEGLNLEDLGFEVVELDWNGWRRIAALKPPQPRGERDSPRPAGRRSRPSQGQDVETVQDYVALRGEIVEALAPFPQGEAFLQVLDLAMARRLQRLQPRYPCPSALFQTIGAVCGTGRAKVSDSEAFDMKRSRVILFFALVAAVFSAVLGCDSHQDTTPAANPQASNNAAVTTDVEFSVNLQTAPAKEVRAQAASDVRSLTWSS